MKGTTLQSATLTAPLAQGSLKIVFVLKKQPF